MNQILRPLVLLALLTGAPLWLCARDLRITLPKHSDPTPVQKLNQEGVKAINKHELKKAEQLFYKAYLLDPDDPFTLNNLGYISELQGKVERALRYYQLAAAESSDTVIANSSVPELKGKPLVAVTKSFENRDLRVNRGNVQAMSLLEQGRAAEAENVLRETLQLNPRNAFTLNNLGYTMESEGDLNSAYKYYTDAAGVQSKDTVIVAPDPRWRGKPISEVATNNARAVTRRIDTEDSREAQVARLNLQGVSALNHNDPKKARQLFERAYQIDPHNAFALNNMGYVAELEGDEETAQDFYQQARRAPEAGARVTAASRRDMQGRALADVAEVNDQASQTVLDAEQAVRRRQGGPILLKRRDNTVIGEPEGQQKPLQTQPNPNPLEQNPQPQN